MRKNYFILYPICILVKGKNSACIYDLQRGEVYRIPLDLYNLFDKDSTINLINAFSLVKGNMKSTECIREYIAFLEENDLGLISDVKIPFKKLETDYCNPRIISNCIIDFDNNSKHPLPTIHIE